MTTYSKCPYCGGFKYDVAEKRCTDQDCLDSTFSFNCPGCLEHQIVVNLDPGMALSSKQFECPNCQSTLSIRSGPEKGVAIVQLVASRRHDYEFTKHPTSFRSLARGGGVVR